MKSRQDTNFADLRSLWHCERRT